VNWSWLAQNRVWW